MLLSQKEAKTPLFDAEQMLMLWLIPIAGLLAGALTYASIIAWLKAIEHLHHLYDDYARSRTDDASAKRPQAVSERHFTAFLSKGRGGQDREARVSDEHRRIVDQVDRTC